MKFGDTSSVFGVEKENGKLNGILASVYQDVFGQEVYPRRIRIFFAFNNQQK